MKQIENKTKIESISIGLASPIRIRKWAERILPNGKKIGEITTSKTVDYKTFKPEPGGLFCEKIFGPINDFECSCGTKKLKSQNQFCPNCDVEFTASRVRRYRLGYIKLVSPVVHIWYLKGRPSFISLLLNIDRKRLESIIYYTKSMYVPIHSFLRNTIKDSESSNKQVKREVLKNKTTPKKSTHKNAIQLSLLDKYYLRNFTNNWSKNILLKTQLNGIFCNSYHAESKILEFESLQNSEFIFPNLKAKLVNQGSLHPKRSLFLEKINQNKKKSQIHKFEKNIFLNTNKSHSKKKINKKRIVFNSIYGVTFHSALSLILSVNVQNKLKDKKTSLTVNAKLRESFKSFESLNQGLFRVVKQPLNLETSNQFLFSNLPNPIKLYFLRQNLYGYRNRTQKNGNKLSTGPSDIKNINIPFTIQSRPTMYYPIASKCRWKSTCPDGVKLSDTLDKWKTSIRYLISSPTKYDIAISFYKNRVLNQSIVIDDAQYTSASDVATGTEAIWYILKSINLPRLRITLRDQLQPLDSQIKKLKEAPFLYKFEKRKLRKLLKIRLQTIRRLKLFVYFQKSKLRPEWLILSILPVLPPDLRPIIQLDGNQIAVSDLNQLYKRVLDRNKRIKNALKTYSIHATEMRYNQRLLQEAVDALIENGKGGTPPACAPNGRAFKSLSEILKGKKGRFRLNLLGKRVDYSGRSVIVVGPELKLHECGLPKEMAVELFQPFIIRELRKNNSEITIVKAKKLIQQQRPIIWNILKKILRNHPILLNRAPTLHRLGIQAFQAKLVEGRAILLHPLVCTAFNADFDGDQMAVHVPLSFQARAEAWKLMWSRNNILSPATGDPIIVPSQDMVLGCYYTTTNIHETISVPVSREKYALSDFFNLGTSDYFSHLSEVLIAFKQKKISLHSLIWVRWSNRVQIENFSENPLELRINCYGNNIQVYSKYWRNVDKQSNQISQFIHTTPGRVLLNKIILENRTT